MDQQQTDRVSLGAVLVMPVLFLLAGILVLFNLVVAALTDTGPDSCGTVSCSGSPLLAMVFVGIAVFSAVSALGTVFTLRPSRLPARCVLIAMALVVPVFADAVAFAAAPDWL